MNDLYFTCIQPLDEARMNDCIDESRWPERGVDDWRSIEVHAMLDVNEKIKALADARVRSYAGTLREARCEPRAPFPYAGMPHHLIPSALSRSSGDLPARHLFYFEQLSTMHEAYFVHASVLSTFPHQSLRAQERVDKWIVEWNQTAVVESIFELREHMSHDALCSRWVTHEAHEAHEAHDESVLTASQILKMCELVECIVCARRACSSIIREDGASRLIATIVAYFSRRRLET